MSLLTPDTIKAIAEEVGKALPEYVPAMPSIMLGLSITIGCTILGTVLALMDRRKHQKSNDTLVKYRWIVIVLVFAALGTFVGDYAQDKDYTIRCIRTNRQHYANVHWLTQYMRSARA
jgi:hypothetical protein